MNKSKAHLFSKLDENNKKIHIQNIINKYNSKQYPINEKASLKHNYIFWSKLPHAKKESDMFSVGQISNDNTEIEIDSEKYSEYIIEYTNAITDELCSFINIHMYRKTDIKLYYDMTYLDYLMGNNKQIFVLKTKKDMKIAGTICGGIKTFKVGRDELKLSDVRVLCVHKNLRDNRLAELLMKTYINKMKCSQVNEGIYFSNMYTSIPNTKLDMYYRPINYSKIKNCGLYRTSDEKLHEYNEEKFTKMKYVVKNVVPYEKDKHLDKIYELYVEYMNKYNIYCVLDKTNFSNLVSNNVSYVFIDAQNNPSDFFVLGKMNAKYNKTSLKISMVLLYTNNSTEYMTGNIMNTASSISKKLDFDMMMMYDNYSLDELTKETDGYYIKTNIFRYINLYNWLYPKVNSNQIGFI